MDDENKIKQQITSPSGRFTIYCQAKRVNKILPKNTCKKVAVI
jgi:topoisomerase IA-like protein